MSAALKAAGIIGVGRALPERVVTNTDIANMGIDTSDEWIRERTGIVERRIADDETATSDLATLAAQDAIADAGIDVNDIDLIIVSTSTPDHPLFPSVACLVQQRLGLSTNVTSFDVVAACTGFNYALTTGAQYIQTGQAKTALVISADVLSKFVDWEDRTTCILFGDGAGAVVLSTVADGKGLLHSRLFSDGSHADILQVPSGGSRSPVSAEVLDARSHYIQMQGRSVFKVAVNAVVPSVGTVLEEAGISPQEVSLYVFHQANLRIIDAAVQRLGLSPDQVITTLDRYGNTSAASIPITLKEAQNEGRLNAGDLIVMVGFGAGFTWGVSILRY